MVATGLGFAGFVGVLAAAGRRLRRHAQPELGRRQRVPAAGACAAGARGQRRGAHHAVRALQRSPAPLCAAVGALAAGVPDCWRTRAAIARLDALRAHVRRLRRARAARSGCCTGDLPRERRARRAPAPAPLGPSRGDRVRLAALFCVDAFAGGLVVQSLLALWLFAALRPVARAGRGVLLLGRAAERGLAARGAAWSPGASAC